MAGKWTAVYLENAC